MPTPPRLTMGQLTPKKALARQWLLIDDGEEEENPHPLVVHQASLKMKSGIGHLQYT